jgi:hypothetical protein
MIVAVPLAFSTRATKATIAKVPKVNWACGFPFNPANVHIRGPVVETPDVAHTDEVTLTFAVGITITRSFFTRTTDKTVIIVSLTQPTGFGLRINAGETYVYLRAKTELATQVIHTKKAFFAFTVTVTVPREFFAGATE